jgi:hypothetical protein
MMWLVENILWFFLAWLCNAHVVGIHAMKSLSRAVSSGLRQCGPVPAEWGGSCLPWCHVLGPRDICIFHTQSCFVPLYMCTHHENQKFAAKVVQVMALATLITIILSSFSPCIFRTPLHLVIQFLINFPWRKCVQPIIYCIGPLQFPLQVQNNNMWREIWCLCRNTWYSTW